MTQVINLLVGLLLGIAVSAPVAILFVKRRFETELNAAGAVTEQLRIELATAHARRQDVEAQSQAKTQEWMSERSKLQLELSDLSEARLKALEGLARSEEVAKSSNSLVLATNSERENLINALETARTDSEFTKIGIATQKSRADQAERTKIEALIEKQIACDLLIETERKAQTQSRVALVETHQLAMDQLTAHLAMREKEYEKTISALELSRNTTEAPLREGYEKEVKAKEDMFTDVQAFLKKADETLHEAFGDASTKALQRASESFFELAKKRFDERDETAKTNANAHKKELELLLEPVKEELGELEKLNREIEKERLKRDVALEKSFAWMRPDACCPHCVVLRKSTGEYDNRMYDLPGATLASSLKPTQSLDSAERVAEELDAYVQSDTAIRNPPGQEFRGPSATLPSWAFRITYRQHAGLNH